MSFQGEQTTISKVIKCSRTEPDNDDQLSDVTKMINKIETCQHLINKIKITSLHWYFLF